MSALLAVALAASVNRPVEAFHEVELSGGLTVKLHKGAAAAVTLSGDAADLEKIEVFTKGGRLVIRSKANTMRNGSVTADVTVTSFDRIEASGGIIVSGEGLSGAKCTMLMSGGVQADLGAMTCDALQLEASGGAQVKLAGTSKKLQLDASGGVQLETRALSVSAARIRASGGVTGAVAVADDLDAEVSGGVNLKVKGHPKATRAEASGGGKLSYE